MTYHMGAIKADFNLEAMVSGGIAGVDVFTTIAHEYYGHIVPGLDGQGNWNCRDGAPGTPAAQSCSVRRENDIRRDLGRPLRQQY